MVVKEKEKRKKRTNHEDMCKYVRDGFYGTIYSNIHIYMFL